MKMRVLSLLITAFISVSGFASVGLVESFDIPDGEIQKGPALPGSSFSFTTTILPGEKLFLASMYGLSNDWFFAVNDGIDVYKNLKRTDYTDALELFDAGTEIDENNQGAMFNGPNQTMPNEGPKDPVPYVRSLSQFHKFNTANFLSLRIYALGSRLFKVILKVKETSVTGISPGVFYTSLYNQIFDLNAPARNNGLEELAESGNNTILLQNLRH